MPEQSDNHEQTIGSHVELQRGNTYKSVLLDLPGPYLLGLASIERNGGFRSDKLRTYGGPTQDKLLVRPGDLYVSLKDITQAGDLLGSVARVPPYIELGRMTQDTVKLVFKNNQISKAYLYWCLRTPNYKDYCRARALGTTNLSLSRDDFLSYPIPEMDEIREHIISILEGIEEKIELNRQMNTTLEAMAQALFKSWFVDFDPVIDNALAAGNPIPDALKEKAAARAALGDARKPLPEDVAGLFPAGFVWTEEMGWIPDGWEVGQLQDLLVLQRGFDLPKAKRTDGSFPLIASSGQDGTHNVSKATAPGVVTGRSGRIGIVTFVHDDYWPLNTTLWVKEYKHSNPYHAYFLLQTIDLDKYRTGSAVPTLNRNHVHSLPQVLPSLDALNEFTTQAIPVFEKQRKLKMNINSLKKLRDVLLPKLLSGELRIPDAEKLIEDAGV